MKKARANALAFSHSVSLDFISFYDTPFGN